jgi:type 1 glutamine amidotransferase
MFHRALIVGLLIVGLAVTAQAQSRKHLLVLISEQEYETAQTLPAFITAELKGAVDVTVLHGAADDAERFEGLEQALTRADGVMLSVRRRALPEAQMAALKAFIHAGKPVIGIRTSSHAFSLKGKPPAAGRQTWETFDRDIIGGNYHNHLGRQAPLPRVTAANGADSHPILTGVALPFTSGGSLYMNDPLPESSTVLLIGTSEGFKPEPVAWTTKHVGGGRTFYTSLGHKGDFEQPAFRALLRNGLLWALGDLKN